MTNRDSSSVPSSARRSFLGRLIGGAVALTTLGATPRLLGASERTDGATTAHPGDDWMRELKGKHRTVFDMSAHKNGKPLQQAKNYLDAWRDAFNVQERDINLVFGVHGEAIPMVLTDALWSRYKLGEQYEVTDGGTKGAAVRNVFASANATGGGLVSAEQSVDGLQKRGVRFVVCQNTINGASKKLSAAGLGSADEIKVAITGGMLPGVMIVPAMVVALTQLQEHGLKYTKIA